MRITYSLMFSITVSAQCFNESSATLVKVLVLTINSLISFDYEKYFLQNST